MAETYRTTLKLRRGYAEVWERNNPVLQEGEPGFALDTKVLKIGDGVTPWLELKGTDSNDGNYDDIISELESKLIGKPGSGQNSEIFNDANNQATGNYSHAEGEGTVAGGIASHSEGKGTKATGDYQHAQGKYNVEDTENKYAHIVGGGTEGARKNIHTLDWQGNAWFAGNLKIGGTGPDDPNAITISGDCEDSEEQAQSDWEMSDNTNPAYIKNRPFYDDTRTEYVVELNEYMHGFPISEKTLVAGETYDVEFGAPGKYEDMTWQSLQLTAKEFTATKNYVSAGISSGETLVYIGNLKAIDRGLTNTGEDFCIYTSRYGGAILRTLAASNVISYQISVGQTVADFKALDEKFIPKSIARAADIPKLEATIAQATEAAEAAASSARTHAEQAAQSAQEAKDAADRAGAAGGGGGYIASDEPPEDTSALWIDTSEPDEAVALGATVVETEEGVEIYATDELGTTTAMVRHGRDGAPGAPGEPGKPGKTPVKGEDYFTQDELAEVARQAAGMVEVPGGGGAQWRKIAEQTIAEDSDNLTWVNVTQDMDGKPLNLKKIMLICSPLFAGSKDNIYIIANREEGHQANYVVTNLTAYSNNQIISVVERIHEKVIVAHTTTQSLSVAAAVTVSMRNSVYPIDGLRLGLTTVRAGTKYEVWGVDN